MILDKMVVNFTGFAPLGIVLVAMLGIGVAESSGLIGALIRMLVLSAPKRMLTFVLVFSGILSNLASDVGYVLLIPMAGVDLGGLQVVTRVNGQERQRGSMDQMVFQIPFLISYVSAIMTLEPGDVLATGTPEGVGPLAAGDMVEVELPGLGTVMNPVVAGEES